MGCIVEFAESLIQFEFCSKGDKQKILIDILLKYSGMDMVELAASLEIPVKKLRSIRRGKSLLMGEQVDNLSQVFLIFFGRKFFNKFSIIRNYL